MVGGWISWMGLDWECTGCGLVEVQRYRKSEKQQLLVGCVYIPQACLTAAARSVNPAGVNRRAVVTARATGVIVDFTSGEGDSAADMGCVTVPPEAGAIEATMPHQAFVIP